MDKRELGQFFTTNADIILEGMSIFAPVIEPFAGGGDLIIWSKQDQVEEYDIDPKRSQTIKRDTLRNPPDYNGKFVLTNPPFLAQNKNKKNGDLYEKYECNDLYKCFILELCNQNPEGGAIIIPAGFFFSPRKRDEEIRQKFMSKFKILRINYFEDKAFEDSVVTVASVWFRSTHLNMDLEEQDVLWVRYMKERDPIEKVFRTESKYGYIVGGEIYNLSSPSGVTIGRYTDKSKQVPTSMTLCALDSGKDDKIRLEYKPGYVYPAKDTSRTYATITISGKTLTLKEQEILCDKFNSFLNEQRDKLWSLFLPQYREAGRKRIPFELAYSIIGSLIEGITSSTEGI